MSNLTKIESVASVSLPDGMKPEQLSAAFDAVKKEVLAEVFEPETESGRKRIKKVAANVNKALKAVDDPIRLYLKDVKSWPKTVEAVARENKAKYVELYNEVIGHYRKSVESSENSIGVVTLQSGYISIADTVDALLALRANVDGVRDDEVVPEMKKKFNTAILEFDELYKAKLQSVEEKIRLEKELQESREREAAAAAKARAEALAEQRIKDAETEAERARNEAANAEKQAIINAERELERQAMEQEELSKKRQADRDHRGMINKSAYLSLLEHTELTGDQAKDVVRAIAKNRIKNVKIHY